MVHIDFLVLKWVHILSSVLMVGTGFGSAFYMFFANRSGCLPAQVFVSRLVVRADWWFTTPTMLIQPITGLWMAHLSHVPVTFGWLAFSISLYCFAGACWLPVVWLQIELKHMAQLSITSGHPLPKRYWRYARYWEYLGCLAFLAMILIFYMMVVKKLPL
jgi:uncharacterized membrane protein